MKTKIISFYSDLDDKYYSISAKKLIASCTKFNIPFDIVELPSKKSYMLNCLQKPKFIKSMMEKHKSPLIWMDCDTNLILPFDTFDNRPEDIGFATHSGKIDGMKASPIYFNNTEKFNLIIDWWIKACEDGLKLYKTELDHDALKMVVLPRLMNKIKIFLLSENYNDYCNGKYIKNGNSVSKEKRLVHKKMNDINKKRII